jgi:hypothetical protein
MKSKLVKRKRAMLEQLRIRKHQQNTAPKRLTAVLAVQKLFTLTGARHNPVMACRLSTAEKKVCASKNFHVNMRSILVKYSKQFRREPAAALHGDYRRSLYEVTIISIVKPQSTGKNAQNKAF